MIVEGVLTTVNADGGVNIAPLGPVIDQHWRQWRLRPFQTARTFANLLERRAGVFHVTDDVLLLAQAAIGPVEPPPKLRRAEQVDGWIIDDACRWYELEVTGVDDSRPRAEIDCRLVAEGRRRDFFGFNRAKHAVLEAAILATRVGILPDEEIFREFARLAAPVEKTGGAQEREALALLTDYVRRALGGGTAEGGALP